VTAEAAPLEAYVGEQVTVTVRFYQGVRLLERPDYRPPAATGFWVENLPGERTYYTEIEGRQYHVTELHSALFPTAAGELTIGPATVSCVIETDPFGRDPFSLFRSGFGAGDRRAIETKPIKIRARPVPREGRPADWSGAVGRYRLEARLDPTRVKVGEAATLTVTLAGQGNVRAVGDPGLPDIAGLRSFDSGSAVQDTVLGGVVGGVKRFTRVLVPEASGSFTVPAIAYSVFRPDLHQFETIRTAPIALEVIEDGGAGLPGGTGSPGTHVLTAQGAGDLRFIRLGDPGLRPRREPLWADRRFWLQQLLPMAGFGVVMLLARHRERVRIDVGYARLRRSGGEARRRLKAARHHLERGDARTFYGAVAQALLGYVADRTNVPVAGLTPSEARARLEERELDPEVVAAFSALIERCDFGRFAPSPDGGQREVLNEAERVLRGLARAGL
jgi:hypothetical protein